MKARLLRTFLALSVLSFVAPSAAQSADLTKAPLKWGSIRRGQSTKELFPRTVEAVQYLLRYRGVYSGQPSRVFDAKTVTAIKAFQKRNRLKVDGILGPQTLPHLVFTLRRGARGDAVRAAQILVRGVADHVGGLPNSELAVDGVFGNQTQQAVKTAQACLSFPEERLKQTGVMDQGTWCILLGGDVVIS